MVGDRLRFRFFCPKHRLWVRVRIASSFFSLYLKAYIQNLIKKGQVVSEKKTSFNFDM